MKIILINVKITEKQQIDAEYNPISTVIVVEKHVIS